MSITPVMPITDELIAELERTASENHAYVPVEPAAMRALLAERAKLKRDAELYRFVRELAWYVDRASYIYQLGNHAQSKTPWSDLRVSVDADDVEVAIDAAMQAAQ